MRGYQRTRRNKIVLTGKTIRDDSLVGRFTNFLQRQEADSPLAVSSKHKVRRQ